MTCRELADFIDDYLAGQLPPDARLAFEQHLSLCVNCRRYLTAYQESTELARRAFDDVDVSLAEDVPEDLVKAILAARRS